MEKTKNKFVFDTKSWDSYELIDAGGGKKLERFGEYLFIRPELQAYFKSEMPFEAWNTLAHYEFVEKNHQKGYWKKLKPALPDSFELHIDGMQCKLELTQFKHIGIFPEQYINWKWIQEKLPANGRFLNLFAYTGLASIAAKFKSPDREVLHVDSVKQLITWSKQNQELNELEGIKWVLEDALKFAQREVKRGNKYDGICMDPPAFGLGAKGEKWILENQLPLLLEAASQLLNPGGFLILNTYSPKLELNVIERMTKSYFKPSEIQAGELWAKTKTAKKLFYGNLIRIQK